MYLLASHVYLCVTSDHGVLLDLKHDKYVGVGQGQMRALARCVRGWPKIEQAAQALASNATSDAFVAKMVASGILTTDPDRGKDAQPVAMSRPETTLAALDLAAAPNMFSSKPMLRLQHIVSFFRASIAARCSLKWSSISSVVEAARRRKHRQRKGAPLDLVAARQLTAIFVYLRPLLFTTKDACLADSLALVNFLAHYRLFPTWVFGVQTSPFAAHCWVQEGDVVFNDTPDHVRRYTPILTI